MGMTMFASKIDLVRRKQWERTAGTGGDRNMEVEQAALEAVTKRMRCGWGCWKVRCDENVKFLFRLLRFSQWCMKQVISWVNTRAEEWTRDLVSDLLAELWVYSLWSFKVRFITVFLQLPSASSVRWGELNLIWAVVLPSEYEAGILGSPRAWQENDGGGKGTAIIGYGFQVG